MLQNVRKDLRILSSTVRCLFYSKSLPLPYCFIHFHGGSIFFMQKGGLKFTKSQHQKNCNPLFQRQRITTPPPIHFTPNKQTQIESVFLKKINTLSMAILWLPTFWSSKFNAPLPIFQQFITPSIGAPILRKMSAIFIANFPLHSIVIPLTHLRLACLF